MISKNLGGGASPPSDQSPVVGAPVEWDGGFDQIRQTLSGCGSDECM